MPAHGLTLPLRNMKRFIALLAVLSLTAVSVHAQWNVILTGKRPSAPPGVIALVAHTAGTAPSFPIPNPGPGIDTTGANLIVIAQAYLTGQGGGDTPTDSQNGNSSNTYIPLGSPAPYNSGSGVVQLYYCMNPVHVGTNHTFSCANLGYNAIFVEAFSGLTSGLDTGNYSGGTNSSGSTVQPGGVTPGEATSLVVTGLACWDGGAPYTINSGYTISDQINSSGTACTGAAAYQIFTSIPSAQNPTWTVASPQGLAAAIAVFH